ncbi:hypothetical protein O1611_g3626 [Lasiodiplodia mahajangana]|uniref:Uncharacterized protein n=1 Tax=Lasiodiplodia mahajangana TaxID=1108764 RepID=A0ACC2JRI3_9PEZI|nr:hypothetical protein O1611_g3626 [Lasiodiplodia mahajangana]
MKVKGHAASASRHRPTTAAKILPARMKHAVAYPKAKTKGSTFKICGYGPKYCGDTCISNCDAHAECGRYAEDEGQKCPLNVCCSEFGFCGTTPEFCEKKDECDSDDGEGCGCQSNCFTPDQPSCSTSDVTRRVIGYYESWSSTRKCDAWRPNDIAAGEYTHLFFSFMTFTPFGEEGEYSISFGETAESVPDMDLLREFIALKDENPGLSCYMAIGGWAFNDPPTADYWSKMASTKAGRESWSETVLLYMQEFGFDGVDLDWEYPSAKDRGGSPEDLDNYVLLLKQLRQTLDASGRNFGLSFTIPTSYWYLKGFDIKPMVEIADFVNVMSYDLHGTWDGNSPWTQDVLAAHTNLTEISMAMDLLWRNDVDTSKIVMGMGFYGRSFTMTDPGCSTPGCDWAGGGRPGECTDTSGILSYKGEISTFHLRKTRKIRMLTSNLEIVQKMKYENAELIYDDKAAITWLTWDLDQWVSFDNEKTFKQKLDWASDRCLGGIMIWAVDQDTRDYEALSALLGKEVSGNNLLDNGNENKQDLAAGLSAYTGEQCYVSECMDFETGECKPGYSILEYAHSAGRGVIEQPDNQKCKTGEEGDEDSQYRLICCPEEAMPESCTWTGGVCVGDQSDFCGDGKFQLVRDAFTDRTGSEICVVGGRSLCCNSNPQLELCSWTSCGGDCPKDKPEAITGFTVWEGPNTYENCKWMDGDYCEQSCPKDKILISQRSKIWEGHALLASCDDGYAKLCCDPPDASNSFPVDPKDIFKDPDEDNISYFHDVQEDNNMATSQSKDEDEQAFAFVMLEGDPEAFDQSLKTKWTFVDEVDQELSKRDSNGKRYKRNYFQDPKDAFNNVREKFRIRCNSRELDTDGTACSSIFKGGARNTIVELPDHVGQGPFARVISLEPVSGHSFARNLGPRAQEVYDLEIDYDLAAAAEDEKGDVRFRVDYSNLESYWDDVTDEPAEKRKRWFGAFKTWLKKVTTITKEDEGSLPLEYWDKRKLFHFERVCPASQAKVTVDLDAEIRLQLNSNYAYYFEGNILPSPKVNSAYAYFAVDPIISVGMTLRGEATVQTNTEEVYLISGVGFPGLSIKGLISIGPELDVTASMDASLSVSGVVDAWVVAEWDTASVYFPQDEGGKDASEEPGENGDALEDGSSPSYTITPTLEASVEAEGHLSLHMTPQVRFGITVLAGQLMEGTVKAGVTNTFTLGFSASASSSGNAEFCYWADYLYSLFVGADVSFLGDVAHWGGEYEVASSDEPIALIEKKCAKYGDSDGKRLQDRAVAKRVDKVDEKGCFGGLIQCTKSEDVSNCIPAEDESGSDNDGLTVRAGPDPTCYKKPGMFYNCDFFPHSNKFDNLNENTMRQSPQYEFIGICKNIQNYLQKPPPSGTYGSNWMEITYKPGSGGGNRNDACADVSKSCASTKTQMWPTRVSSLAANPMPGDPDYQLERGYSALISCDEFPFNASEEGGNGAEAACVPVEQQNYQGQINSIIQNLKDTKENKKWSDPGWPAANKRKYTVNLIWGSSTGSNLGVYAGEIHPQSQYQINHVIGGVNTFGNPLYELGNNCVCQISANKGLLRPSMVEMYTYTHCKVTFVTGSILSKRGLDPDDPNNWEVQDAELLPGWEKTAFNEDGTPFLKQTSDAEGASAYQAMITSAPDIRDMILPDLREKFYS